jgi:hypothetical protein
VSQRLTIRQICEGALEKVGALSIYDREADAEELERAAFWLDALVGHIAGTRRRLWLQEDTLEIPLEADRIEYELQSYLGANYPDRGIQWPMHAVTRHDGFDYDCHILTRQEYDDIADKDSGGRPRNIYLDRLNTPTMKVHPVPSDSGFTIRLTYQAFNDTLFPPGRSPRLSVYNQTIDVRRAWNLYLMTALARQIGDGPVRKLPQGELDQHERHADKLLGQLESVEDQEHADEARRVKFTDF